MTKMAEPLPEGEIQKRLNGLEGWQLNGNLIEKKFRFKLFKEAMEFFNKVGEVAEKLNHHPDILLYNYNRVKVSSTTHLVGGRVTENDFELAETIEKIPRQEFIPKKST
jgi:4a-hydroxytetrahydrobiopterin dehydratase